MAQFNQVDTLNGLFKIVYADKIKDLIPEGVKLLKMIPFNSAQKALGNTFNTPVVLGLEHGITYGGSAGQAFSLNQSIASEMQEAQVKGCEMVLRSSLSVGAAARSISSQGAFEQATKLLVRNMLKSMHIRLEAQLLYGQVGIARIADVSAAPTITICAAEWAPGIWVGSKNMLIEVRSQAGTLRGTATVESVDMAARTITLDALPALTTGNADPENSAADVIYYAGAYGKEFAGLHKMIVNTSTIFNINAAQYELFKGNIVNVGTNATSGAAFISFEKIEEAVAVAMEKGLMDEDVTALVHPKQWNKLMTDLAAKRMFDSSYSEKSLKQGTQAIEFYGQNGKISVVASLFVKEGAAYVFPEKELERIGSTDVTFEMPGYEGKFFRLLEDVNGYELRAYTDQALFSSAIGQFTLLKGSLRAALSFCPQPVFNYLAPPPTL
jgi:hypothetical protein